MSAGTMTTALLGERTTHDEVRLTIRNDLDELVRVNRLTNELLARRGVDDSVVYATELALEEVLSNVVRHAYQDRGPHEIGLVLRVGERGVELQIADDGLAFDPVDAPAPDLDVPLASRRAGGLGIHLLRAFVREIRYERRGERNVLWMRI